MYNYSCPLCITLHPSVGVAINGRARLGVESN